MKSLIVLACVFLLSACAAAAPTPAAVIRFHLLPQDASTHAAVILSAVKVDGQPFPIQEPETYFDLDLDPANIGQLDVELLAEGYEPYRVHFVGPYPGGEVNLPVQLQRANLPAKSD